MFVYKYEKNGGDDTPEPHIWHVENYNLVSRHLPNGRLPPVVVVEESPEEEAVAKAEVAVVVAVDLTLIHNKLLHNSSNNNNNSSGLVRCQDRCMAVTGNAIKSTAAKRRLIVLRHMLTLLQSRYGLPHYAYLTRRTSHFLYAYHIRHSPYA